MKLSCLACGGQLGNTFFSIPDLPLVDSFCSSAEEALSVPCYSVDICQCSRCLTIQIASPPDTSEIYKNYIYESSSSPDLSHHFDVYAQYIASLAISNTTHIMEIGANDGLLLSKLANAGFTSMLAIDPSPQTSHISIEGVEIINDFFSESSVSHLETNSFGIIIANNCFSHIPNLSGILSLCSKLLEPSGTIVIEVQSCLDLVEGVIFDYIYHEHYFYHTAQSFEKIARMSGLDLYHIDHVPTKGGSYRFLIGHAGQHTIDSSVSYWKYREELAGIHKFKTWKLMENYLQEIKKLLHKFIENDKRRLIGYGASATGTVLMRYMNIESKVSAIVDDNPKRQGLYAPRTAIPVNSPAALKDTDSCLILAWRHFNHIAPNLKKQSISYVLPLPTLKVSG